MNNYRSKKWNINEKLKRIIFIKKDIIKRKDEIEANLKKYNLVERSSIVDPEEEQQIKEDLGKIEAIEEVFYKLSLQTDKKIEQAISMLRMKNREERRQELKRQFREIESLIKQPSNPVGMNMNIDDEISCLGTRDIVVSEKIQTLVKEYCAYNRNERRPIGPFDWLDKTISFQSYEECGLEGKQKIREYEQRVTKILRSEDERFDKPGRISIPVYLVSGTVYLKIDVTPRELARAGIDYTDFNWKSIEQLKKQRMAKVTPKTIANATLSLPTRAISNVRELFSKRNSRKMQQESGKKKLTDGNGR